MSIKHTFGAASIVSLLVLATLSFSQDPPEEALMRSKSQYAHDLLDALVAEDFEQMKEQAFRLKTVALTADWKASESDAFVKQGDAFIHAADELIDAAERKNGDAAALAYFDVTLKCLHCHRYLRRDEQP